MPRSSLPGTILNVENPSNISPHERNSPVQAGQTAGCPSKKKLEPFSSKSAKLGYFYWHHRIILVGIGQGLPLSSLDDFLTPQKTYLQHSEADLSSNSKIFFFEILKIKIFFFKISRWDLESSKIQPMRSAHFGKVVRSLKMLDQSVHRIRFRQNRRNFSKICPLRLRGFAVSKSSQPMDPCHWFHGFTSGSTFTRGQQWNCKFCKNLVSKKGYEIVSESDVVFLNKLFKYITPVVQWGPKNFP